MTRTSAPLRAGHWAIAWDATAEPPLRPVAFARGPDVLAERFVAYRSLAEAVADFPAAAAEAEEATACLAVARAATTGFCELRLYLPGRPDLVSLAPSVAFRTEGSGAAPPVTATCRRCGGPAFSVAACGRSEPACARFLVETVGTAQRRAEEALGAGIGRLDGTIALPIGAERAPVRRCAATARDALAAA